ncbi:carbohydrate ABC transporter permease [Cohnella endophytica]|uniref:carbohydrate ABC transporter permease n=1 Tax=Cohnella endophytica TaxID=2419778 RepID=UPI001314757F|nr:sugar ABC transporter permease [Cohnella endophytica]
MKAGSKSKLNRTTTITGIAFLIPAVVMITFAIFIPTIWNFILSFQHWDGGSNRSWVGLDNYKEVFADKTAIISIKHSVYLSVTSTFVAVIVGVVLAVLIYRLGRKEGMVYRLILFIPSMMPLAIIGVLFTFIYNPEMGLLNQFLKLIGADSLATAWLEDKNTVLNAVVFVGIWRIAGLAMMLCFAAMQGIPISLLESSRLDGAGYFKQITQIIIPLIKPIVLLSFIFTLVMQFKTYDLVFVLTKGGPGNFSKTVPLHMIDTAFSFGEYGQSAAMGFLFAIIVTFFILLTNRLLRGESYEY